MLNNNELIAQLQHIHDTNPYLTNDERLVILNAIQLLEKGLMMDALKIIASILGLSKYLNDHGPR